MSGRNPAPWILAVTVLLAAAVFVIVGQQDPGDVSGRHRGTAAMIVIGAGIVVMVIAQTIWTSRSVRRAELAALRAAGESGGDVGDPAGLSPDALLMALATVDVDPEAVLAASSQGWDIARRSQRSAALMTVLVIALMVPAIALQKPRLIVIAAVPIVLYAVVLAVRVIRPGGTIDRSYAAADVQLSPLGLRTLDRPDLMLQPQIGTDAAQLRLVGQTVFGGQRHGRTVTISVDSRHTQTSVAGAFPAFTIAGRRQRLTEGDSVPGPVATMLEALRPSPRWTSVDLTADADGIVVKRRSGSDRAWLYDLWLAERVAALSATNRSS